jgi:hypothetical protein
VNGGGGAAGPEPPERRTIQVGGGERTYWRTAPPPHPAPPSLEALPRLAGDLAVDRLSWTAPGRRPVVVYRTAGGGHGWPSGPQYLPARFAGRMARHLDATGILLDFARAQL